MLGLDLAVAHCVLLALDPSVDAHGSHVVQAILRPTARPAPRCRASWRSMSRRELGSWRAARGQTSRTRLQRPGSPTIPPAPPTLRCAHTWHRGSPDLPFQLKPSTIPSVPGPCTASLLHASTEPSCQWFECICAQPHNAPDSNVRITHTPALPGVGSIPQPVKTHRDLTPDLEPFAGAPPDASHCRLTQCPQILMRCTPDGLRQRAAGLGGGLPAGVRGGGRVRLRQLQRRQPAVLPEVRALGKRLLGALHTWRASYVVMTHTDQALAL